MYKNTFNHSKMIKAASEWKTVDYEQSFFFPSLW